MLNVTIQNDGKIKIQSEYSNTKDKLSTTRALAATMGDALESVGCICKIIEK